MVSARMSFTQVLSTYTILTIGEGLATQIPSLLISTATGIMVTRVASSSGVGAALGKQFLSQPRSLRTVGYVLLAIGVFGFFTELPALPFLAFGAGFLFVATLGDSDKARLDAESHVAPPPSPERVVEDALAQLEAPPLELVLGLSLLPLVDAKRGAGIAKRLTLVRQNLSREFGLPLPEVRVRDGSNLAPRAYAVMVRGVEMARAEILPSHWLAMNLPEGVDTESLGGVEGREPAFGIAARWVPETSRPAALAMGATLVDSGSVLVTHLTETLRRNMGAVLSRREVVMLVEQLRKRTPSLVEEVVPGLLSLGEVQKVMSLLLDEQVALTDLPTFFESLSLAARENKDPQLLAEACRSGLGRALCSRLADTHRVVQAVALDPRAEEAIENAEKAPLSPEKAGRLRERLQESLLSLMARTRHSVLLTSPKARPMVAQLTERMDPRPWVLSTREILPPFEVQAVAQVGWD
jgi:flagellar biosynthesis protein FlhA